MKGEWNDKFKISFLIKIENREADNFFKKIKLSKLTEESMKKYEEIIKPEETEKFIKNSFVLFFFLICSLCLSDRGKVGVGEEKKVKTTTTTKWNRMSKLIQIKKKKVKPW